MILRNDGSKENKKHGSHIGYMNPKTGELRITDPHDGRLILIRTGMEDMRPESERVSDFFGGINEKTLFEKSRIGFQPGQNYIDGQVFSPIKLIFALTRKSNNPTVETLSPEKINHAIYESFLGAVGQLEGPQGRGFPYEGHTMAPKEVIDAIQNAKSPYEVAEIIRKNWKQIFSEIEAYIAYEKRNTGFGLGEESLT
jgi:hypothetical protein